MRTNRLGHSSVEVTELGFGGGPLGGLFAALDDDTAAGALAAVWTAGSTTSIPSRPARAGSRAAGLGSRAGANPGRSRWLVAPAIVTGGFIARSLLVPSLVVLFGRTAAGRPGRAPRALRPGRNHLPGNSRRARCGAPARAAPPPES
jgi:hypothetical protein